MMNSQVLPAHADEDRRFNVWLERLEQSFQNYLASEDGAAKEALLRCIAETVQSEVDSFPKWVSLHKALKLGRLASSATDLKVFLRHVTFPGVLQGYHELHAELQGPEPNGTAAEGGGPAESAVASYRIPLDITPLSTKTHGTAGERSVREFFQSITVKSEDGLLGLCKLADLHHRINRAAEHDSHQVGTWLDNEQLRSAAADRSTAEREARLEVLQGRDEQRVIETSFGGLRKELGVIGAELQQAEDEEEEARKAYEAAILRKKRTQDKLTHMEAFVDGAANQREVLTKINALRLELDAYNRASAAQRVGLFQGVLSYLGDVRSRVVEDRLAREIPQLFANLVAVFTNSSAAAGEGERTSKYCAARVGQETVRLWKQLNADHLYPQLDARIDDFSAELVKFQSGLRVPSASDAESAGVYRANDCTVVLYFDHLHHDTPEMHVEAQSRVSTCMQMLRARVAQDAAAMDESEDGGARPPRTMHILNCNDVLSPPTWCLPLTHSPQYLSHLWRLAEEALSGDLYVPLEFDTEWESDDPYGSDEEDAPGSRRHAHHLKKTIALPARVSEHVGESMAATFTSALTPLEGDAALAKMIRKDDARERQRLSARRKRDSDYAQSGKQRSRRRRDPVVAEAQSYVSSRPTSDKVRTPYGNGTLVSSAAARTDGMVEIKLEHGATGYFLSSCVQRVADDEETLVKREPVFPVTKTTGSSGRGGRQSEGGENKPFERFVHTNLRLHRVLQRMVARVKVQRLLGDLMGINHANLSLWMHGRTSVGLNRTTEKTISRWLGSYDKRQMRRLLDDTEGDEYSPENAAAFLARLKECKLPRAAGEPSESEDSEEDSEEEGAARRPRRPSPNDAYSSSEFDSEAERASALKYSEDKVNRKFASRDDGASAPPRSRKKAPAPSASTGAEKQISDRASPPAAVSRQPPSAVPHSVPNSRVVSNAVSAESAGEVKVTLKQTADGELLRNLMKSIMFTLKISQGAIAAEYQRSFKYETSQGGVSAWFHYRSVPLTFERMNRCALMWVDDYRAHLSPDEARRFADLRARTEATQQSDAAGGSATSTVGGEEEEGEEEEGSELRSLTETDDGVTAAVAAQLEVEHEAEVDLPRNSPLAAPSVEAAPVADGEDEASAEQISSATQESEGTDMDVAADSAVALHNAAALTEAAEAARREAAARDDIAARAARAKAAFALAEDDDGPEDSVAGDSVPTPKEPAVKEVRTIADLHNAVEHEMYRRHVSQSVAVQEANLAKVGMGQPALSKFLAIATVTNNQRGSKFCQLMLKWLEYSRGRPTPSQRNMGLAAATQAHEKQERDRSKAPSVLAREKEREAKRSQKSTLEGTGTAAKKGPADKASAAFDPYVCGLCAKHISEFTSHKSFHMHLAWCYRRKGGLDPPVEYKLNSRRSRGSNGGSGAAAGENKRKHFAGSDDDEEEDDEPAPADNKRQRSGSNSAPLPAAVLKSSSNATGGSRSRSGGSSALPSTDELGGGDSAVMDADFFVPGDHYESCDLCKEHGTVVQCASCPCVYHGHCCDYTVGDSWHCAKCVESGASTAEPMTDRLKTSIGSNAADNAWILVWSSALRRWRKAVVIAKHPVRSCTVLVKWWRSDNRGGKTIWLDISRGTVLVAEGDASTSAYSRGKLQQQRHSASVKFEDQQRGGANAQFKSHRHAAMQMDGTSGGSVPPGSMAAASGLGGVGALGGEEDEKLTALSGNGMSDTYISSNSLKAALCAAGTACRAVDIAMCSENTNVFACTRPPGHHAGRYGCTSGCLSTGFCLLNNAAMAAIYARVRWGVERVAVVDIDVHFGNGTAELLRNDPHAFFASVHMIYGHGNDGGPTEVPTESEAHHKKRPNLGFYPSLMGQTEITDTYVSVGVYPSNEGVTRSGHKIAKKRAPVDDESDSSSASGSDGEEEETLSLDGSAAATVISSEEVLSAAEPMAVSPTEEEQPAAEAPSSPLRTKRDKKSDAPPDPAAAARQTFRGAAGFHAALRDVIIPQMLRFNPQLLIISAGFDGYISDPIGGQLSLSLDDYTTATKMLTGAMDSINAANGALSGPKRGRVVSLLEGGYDTSPQTLGLAKCVDAHVKALQES